MNLPANSKNLDYIRQRIEDYYSTIHALLSFVSLTTWKEGNKIDGANFNFGRRMDTTSTNRVSPDTQVTPDGVIQPYPDLGYITEIKKSLSNKTEEWDKHILQLLKYDDDLMGWWTATETISDHCIVLLIEISRSVEFSDYLASYLANTGEDFNKPFSIVEFARADEFKPYYILRVQHEFDEIEDEDLKETLRKGKKIPIEDVVATYGEKKFYDSEPEAEFTMSVIWLDIFTDMARDVEYNKSLKAYPLEIDINRITCELQKVYGSTGTEHREAQYPKKAWVKRALDGFVRIGLAQEVSADHYRVSFKPIRGDALEKFAKQRVTASAMTGINGERQLSFLEN
jgi:hypothetical protein